MATQNTGISMMSRAMCGSKKEECGDDKLHAPKNTERQEHLDSERKEHTSKPKKERKQEND